MVKNTLLCPKCGAVVKTVDVVTNHDDNETYRKKKCTKCGHKFYTIEYTIDNDASFRKQWRTHHRNKKYKE